MCYRLLFMSTTSICTCNSGLITIRDDGVDAINRSITLSDDEKKIFSSRCRVTAVLNFINYDYTSIFCFP